MVLDKLGLYTVDKTNGTVKLFTPEVFDNPESVYRYLKDNNISLTGLYIGPCSSPDKSGQRIIVVSTTYTEK